MYTAILTPAAREYESADEAHWQRLLRGRELGSLERLEAHSLCAEYASKDSTGQLIKRDSRNYRCFYAAAWTRVLIAQTPEKRAQWEREEIIRAHQFAASVPRRAMPHRGHKFSRRATRRAAQRA
jgi:hypothetical protein